MEKLALSITASVVALVIMGIVLALTTLPIIPTFTLLPSGNGTPIPTPVAGSLNSVTSNTTIDALASGGSVRTSINLGVYSDSACTTVMGAVDWGPLAPGGTSAQTIYIKNTGGGLSLTLDMTTTNWDPIDANGPIAITWNREGTILQPGQSVSATLTLAVSPGIIGITSYGVQINIAGTS